MTNLEKLKDLLAELFMLDQADLDFGIYRVMNAKRAEVTRFLDHDLLPQVRTELEKIQTGDRAGLETELAKAIQNALALGLTTAEAERAEKVKSLRAQLAATVDVSALENEVLSDLANFFRRYYQGGDFLALRRYKAGVYAIPYEGEEVKLHWANADQYYFKTSEFLRDYTFKLADGKRVHFKLVEADTEADNKKSAAGQERRFILCAADPLVETDGELVIRFEYRPDADKRKQAELNTLANETILNVNGFAAWKSALARLTPTEKNPGRTILEKHLGDYTARNSFDYFIHKDIGGFLRRELDFYIKNEIMHLDDIENSGAPRVEQYLAKIKAIRAIARKIIDFLEQLENFQKKLWLKKKFVVETNYCVTLDRVAEALYPEIAANDAQRDEWVKLFAIDEIMASTPAPAASQGELIAVDSEPPTPGYSLPLTEDFLKANPFLVLDTKFFPAGFKEKLLADNKSLGGAATLDDATDGLLIHSENLQALNLLQSRFHGQVKCAYIDPPYNTGTDGFAYKDTYQHSSWLAMMHDRVRIGTQLLAPGSLFYVSIDRDEHWNLEPLLFQLFGKANFVEDIVWQKAYGGGSKTKLINNLHEYVACFSRDKSALPFLALPPDPKALKYYKLSDSKVSTRGKYRTQPLYTNSNDYRENLTYPLPCPACAQSDPTWNEDWRSIRELLGTNALQLRGKPGSWSYVLVQPNGTETPWSGQLIYPPKQWQWEWQSTRQALINDELLAEFDDGNWVVNYKQYRFDEDGNERGKKPGSIRIGPYTQTGTKEITDLFGAEVIKFPKPTGLIEELIGVNLGGSDLPVLDYFAGSGTTGHAVINLNRDEGENGKRKYILVEMGDYFDTVLKPRIQKVIYSKDWKDGKPVLREGSSHLFKYLRLESYEDALNNLELKRTEAQDDLLRQNAPLREDYLLRYQLDVESAGSASLLNVAAFVNPFAYQLKIATGSVGESRAVNVDLVETFNYLLGLRVSHTDIIRGFKVVTGLNPAGEKTLVIWRNVAEKSNADLDAFFQKQGYNTKDMEFAVIYVNGDNNLENLKRTDETWKVRRTEDEFKRLMFDVQDV